MEITKYGKVIISEDDIMITGFHFDGAKGESRLDAESIAVAWAIKRLTESASQKAEPEVT